MVNPEVSEYIQAKGWKVKGRESWDAVGWQLVFDCPLCGKVSDSAQRRFYVSEATGQWKTFCCSQDGNLVTLKRRLGDMQVKIVGAARTLDSEAKGFGQTLLKSRGGTAALSIVPDDAALPEPGLDVEYHASLLNRPEALAYLTRQAAPGRPGRGFSMQTIVTARLGFRPLSHEQAAKVGTHPDHPEHGWVTIPWYLPDGRLAGFKFRALPATEAVLGRFKREKGAPTVLYGADGLRSKPAAVVTIYEAELDRLSGDQLGLPYGLSVTAGAGTWKAEWTTLLAGVSTIIIAYDADPSGDEGAEKVAEALGRWRCKRLRLPRKDANACLAGTETEPPATAEEMRDAYMGLSGFALGTIRDAGDYTGLLDLDKAKAIGGTTGIPELDAILGGLRGEFTILSGETGEGKTTFSTFWAWSLANAGLGPVFIASPEHPPEDEALKLATMEAGRPFLDLDRAGRHHVLTQLTRKGIMLFDAYGQATTDSLFDTLRYFYLSCGGKFAVIDHMSFFVEDGPEERRDIDRLLKTLARLLIQELKGLHVVLIVHPKNAQGESGGGGSDGKRKLHMGLLKGSSGIRQLAWNVCFIERKERLDGKNRAYVWFEKVRSIFAEKGEVAFQFDKKSLRYTGLHSLATQQQAQQQALPVPSGGGPSATKRSKRVRKDYKRAAANDEAAIEEIDDGRPSDD